MVLTFVFDFKLYATALHRKEDKTEDDNLMSSHLDFFLDYIRSKGPLTFDNLCNHLKHGEITFDLIGTILVPRTIIYAKCSITEAPRALRLKQAKRSRSDDGEPYWEIEAEYVESNERCYAANTTRKTPKFGLSISSEKLVILKFYGAAKIASLPSYPIKYHPQADQLMSKLVERGRKWCELEGVHHRHLKGTGINVRSENVFVSP